MTDTNRHAMPSRKRPQSGLTLVELMIAMVLGLIVVGGVISVIAANRQTYRTNEALSQVQESARTAFELLARDIRQAAATGCGNTNRIANTVNGTGTWWEDWAGIRGYDGATAAPAIAFGAGIGQRVAGTGAILLQGIEGTGLSIENHDVTSANFKINALTTDFANGDILMACDFDHAAIFQVTSYNSSNVTVVHNTGTGTPGNCSKGLGFPTDCSSTNGNPYQFGPNSQIARMTAVTWYIGNNGRPDEGGRSLYRARLRTVGGLPTTAAEEIVAGVTDMQFAFRLDDDTTLTAAPDPTDPAVWDDVNAVEVTLTMDSADRRISTDLAVNQGRLQRSFTTMVGLRNRNE